MEADDELRSLIRAVRQRLDALRRAGIGQISMAPLPTPGPVSRGPAVASRSRPPASGGVAIATAGASSTAARPTPVPAAAAPAVPISVAIPEIRLPVAAAATPAPPSPRPERAIVPPRPAASLFGEPALAPVVPAADREPILTELAAVVSRCTRCAELAATRTQTVFGEGSPTARLMFVGEAPGADEDLTGRPFIGRAGALLTDMITKGMGLTRGEVYIANVIKSRPPENRNPTPDEMKNCLPYLEQQIATIRPEYLCLLGKTAALALLETGLPLKSLRGKWHTYRGIPTIVTYHPAALLRTPAWKKDAWEDLQILMQAMRLKVPDRKKPG